MLACLISTFSSPSSITSMKKKKTIRIDRKRSEFMKNTLWQSFLCLFNEDNNPEEIREEKRKIKKSMLNFGCFGLSRHLSCFLLLFFLISVLLPTRFLFLRLRGHKKIRATCLYVKNATICKTFLEYGIRKRANLKQRCQILPHRNLSLENNWEE